MQACAEIPGRVRVHRHAMPKRSGNLQIFVSSILRRCDFRNQSSRTQGTFGGQKRYGAPMQASEKISSSGCTYFQGLLNPRFSLCEIEAPSNGSLRTYVFPCSPISGDNSVILKTLLPVLERMIHSCLKLGEMRLVEEYKLEARTAIQQETSSSNKDYSHRCFLRQANDGRGSPDSLYFEDADKTTVHAGR